MGNPAGPQPVAEEFMRQKIMAVAARVLAARGADPKDAMTMLQAN
jgi:hypothetical protein